jgi:hypothetical protein
VRYRIDAAPTHETCCHCTICRRTSGAPFVAWFTVPASALRFTAGQPDRLQSSAEGARGFCRRCGTPLVFRLASTPDEIDVTTCSLDVPERVPPRDHTHTASAIDWVEGLGALPRHRGTRA